MLTGIAAIGNAVLVFRYVLDVDTCYHTTYDTRMVEAPRIHGRRLWLIHHDSWSYCLV